MSLMSHAHTVTKFIAGESKPLTGQRLARVLFKSGKNKGDAVLPSVCVSVPYLDQSHIDAVSDQLMPFFHDYLQDAQDRLIKSLYVARDGALDMVTDSDISVDAILAFLVAEKSGDRITADRAKSWFDSTLRENLAVLIADKLGTENLDHPQITQNLAGYRDLFGVLAGGKQILNEMQLNNLEKALRLCMDDADEVCTALSAKIARMRQPKEKKEITILDL